VNPSVNYLQDHRRPGDSTAFLKGEVEGAVGVVTGTASMVWNGGKAVAGESVRFYNDPAGRAQVYASNAKSVATSTASGLRRAAADPKGTAKAALKTTNQALQKGWNSVATPFAQGDMRGAGKVTGAALLTMAPVAKALSAIPGRRYVYRGLAVGENPAAGLTARAPGAVGVSPASHVAGKRASPWISTTKNVKVAREQYGKNGVVRIDLTKVASEVVDLSKGIPGLLPTWRMSRRAINAKEVLIRDHIPAAAITVLKK